ncbi:hypothetical protein ONS95_004387 [Cadophora gregata]|uniref:uncharacterized protein n=1 Tax=Cadophora gregata TaxID=51156 RepID=UPI0026DCDD41|nr:uncharacterized protein ONS95_004387 [Cadophora gregata]KAK0105218.1 hypothetical protein ONS96_004619 [Cadophora gregata f. sp. sojae]KAK0105875.1 hypothetical protein ONS95_004387 [Cadophora gregata]
MVTEEEKQHAMKAGTIPDHAEKFNYDGNADFSTRLIMKPDPISKCVTKARKAVEV